MKKPIKCVSCDGTGKKTLYVGGGLSTKYTCNACNGKGSFVGKKK